MSRPTHQDKEFGSNMPTQRQDSQCQATFRIFIVNGPDSKTTRVACTLDADDHENHEGRTPKGGLLQWDNRVTEDFPLPLPDEDPVDPTSTIY